ncbi:MAG TPA: tRNA 4-thiouridine(8) synthase ThiI, partial [Firmicutes bacterium]|nr:tRNA 4-thiouridine(8) synthase ThiI [Bacillota bacterium]
MDKLFLIHYGEIGLKGENREFFERKLQAGLQRALAPWPGVSVERKHGRLYVSGLPEPEQARARLQRVFGVVAVSPALRLPLDLQAIREGAKALMVEAVGGAGPVTFKVHARRVNKGFTPDSMELQRLLGADLLREIPSLQVDVHQPRLTLRVEIREHAYLYCHSYPGPGGLPLGSSGKGVLLLSGGIDSPVAGWMAMRRGLEIECLHFHTPPFTGPRAVDKV